MKILQKSLPQKEEKQESDLTSWSFYVTPNYNESFSFDFYGINRNKLKGIPTHVLASAAGLWQNLDNLSSIKISVSKDSDFGNVYADCARDFAKYLRLEGLAEKSIEKIIQQGDENYRKYESYGPKDADGNQRIRVKEGERFVIPKCPSIEEIIDHVRPYAAKLPKLENKVYYREN